ncbi:MAG: hypothetical protein J0L84_05525 [Verrucomicrobia bacterium]|nr:hypothetical protein [Verrucomicrobiota bacterium]
MRPFRTAALTLSALLSWLPMIRSVACLARISALPRLVWIRPVAWMPALAGTFHGVSGASITLLRPEAGRVRATNGVPSAFRVELTYTDGDQVLSPTAYGSGELPPGFNPPAKSGAIWRISGTPTRSGVFNLRLTGYEEEDLSGDHFATVQLEITVVDAVPVITRQPADQVAHAGGDVRLDVEATGGSLGYQWLRDDLELRGQTNRFLEFPALSGADAGTYRVRIRNSGGVRLSNPATLTVAPRLALRTPRAEVTALHLPYNGIPGQEYVLESATDLAASAWGELSVQTASEPAEFLVEAPADGSRWFRVRGR